MAQLIAANRTFVSSVGLHVRDSHRVTVISKYPFTV